MAKEPPPPPRGLPVGGKRRPLVPSSRHLAAALSRAVDQAVAGLGHITLASPYDADPATLGALNASVIDHAQLPPVSDASAAVLGAFGRACGHGWALGARLLGGTLRFSGESTMDGPPDECTLALISRASSYSTGEILQGVADVGFFEWTVQTREDPDALDALVGTGRVSREEAVGLLGGAVAAGFAIACAEFEFFTEPVDEGTLAYLQCSLGPHHHRFNYDEPTFMPHENGMHVVYPCTRRTCHVLRTAPPVRPHSHRFDSSRQQLQHDGRTIYLCAEPGCGVFG